VCRRFRFARSTRRPYRRDEIDRALPPDATSSRGNSRALRSLDAPHIAFGEKNNGATGSAIKHAPAGLNMNHSAKLDTLKW
jgi:hypothetical protein